MNLSTLQSIALAGNTGMSNLPEFAEEVEVGTKRLKSHKKALVTFMPFCG